MINKILKTYNFESIFINKAQGSWVWETNGNQYLDVNIFSSRYCGCCHSYVQYLTGLNLKVNHTKSENYSVVENNMQVSEELRSCHIMIVENYPEMTGEKEAPFEIIAFKDGSSVGIFMTI